MLRTFRHISKSKIGTGLTAFVSIGILAGFAMADISNFGTGDIGFGMGASTLAKVGSQRVVDRDMSEVMQRRLQQVRQQRPDADYSTIAGDFDTLLSALIDQRALIAFADKFGFNLSKRLIDAEIAQIPQTRGLNGKFSEQAYQAFLAQQRMTDAEIRQVIAGDLLQKLLLTPVAANAKVSVGMATPYASMLLEAREGQAATIPLDAFRAGLNPTDADLQRYYAANRNRYMVPEQRVIRIASITADAVGGAAPSDQEIADYYKANQATYAVKEMRSLSQVVVADRNTANAIAQRAKAGGTLAAAAAPAGSNAAVSSLTDQTRQAYSSVAGDAAAAAVFAAPSGAVVGPLQSDFGWVVVKVEGRKSEGGKSLEQARGEIAAKLTADKRKQAIEEIVDKVQNAVDEGSNFTEAAAASKLPVTTTPLLMANGSARADAGYKLPAELMPAIKAGFEIAPNDPPEIVTLPNNRGYALVAPAEVQASAPAPLASIKDKVREDWTNGQAAARARAVASAIAAKASQGQSLAEAVKGAGVALPPISPLAARRIQIAEASGPIPAPMRMLFTLAQGKSRMVADPEGRGFFVVKVDKIVPGNALLQPGLIVRMQDDLQGAMGQDYAQQFLAAVRAEMKAKRNEDAIKAEKARLTSGGGS
jgi:peptidyl-prolyl cis-trans isomerase D